MDDTLQSYSLKTVWTPWDEADVLKMNHEFRAELAKIINCEGLLIDLSMDQHAEVRLAVAQNGQTPFQTLKRLSEEDLCITVKDTAKDTLSNLSIMPNHSP
ncbi:hypothetical protein QOZ98_001836 [Planomicrobium stackebrandtii]|uniref:Uncharacterized protein n=1 Tax=Planomicrobium stackebrandtii TaxID=253160 RepID=A0ABU0GVS3_9BACL|nr:hypothetical protein [Planomicrobium stackebrandtii]MDQ0429009.1 hypothetical protein [Planomicrobium stackebrandtii]